MADPGATVTHDGNERLGHPPVGAGATPNERKFGSGLARITKSVSGNLGDSRRDPNLLLSIEVEGSGNSTGPVPAEHHILLSPESHQQQSRASLGGLRVHKE
jgi:hypothetical protein